MHQEGEELQSIEEYETLAEKSNEIDVLQTNMEKLESNVDITGLSPDKLGLDEMMRDGRLRIVTNRSNYIYHDGRDYKMVDQAIKNKVVKSFNKIPIRKKLAKIQEAIEKARLEEKNVQDSELLSED